MSAPVIAFVCLILFLSGFLTSLTSFGGNLFAIPLLTLVMGVKAAIIFGCFTGVVIFASLPLLYRRYILWKELLHLSIGACAGIPVGIWVLANANPRVLLVGASICIFLFLVWQLIARGLHIAETSISAVWSYPAGFVSALMMAAVGMGGPPLVLYAYLRKWGKEETIANANGAVLIQMIPIAPLQWGQNLMASGLWGVAVFGCLCAVLGIFASLPVIGRVNIRLFRAILLCMLFLSALMLLARGIF